MTYLIPQGWLLGNNGKKKLKTSLQKKPFEQTIQNLKEKVDIENATHTLL